MFILGNTCSADRFHIVTRGGHPSPSEGDLPADLAPFNSAVYLPEHFKPEEKKQHTYEMNASVLDSQNDVRGFGIIRRL